MATAGTELEKMRLEGTMDTQEYKSVLEILSEYESMPFLELTSVSDIDDDVLVRIIDDLESKGIVKITNRDNILEEIVTLKNKSAALVSSAP